MKSTHPPDKQHQQTKKQVNLHRSKARVMKPDKYQIWLDSNFKPGIGSPATP
jgi:hypothetical protein